MAPVVWEFKNSNKFEVKVCVTAQHREMLDHILVLFGIIPEYDLNIMHPGQDLTDITTRILIGMRAVFSQWRPEWVMVHGDTTTTLATSLAAYYEKIPVAHVEAGLRTWNKYSPWPEEMNRRITGSIAEVHFAPTTAAQNNLINEGIKKDKIIITGNTVIDALLSIVEKIKKDKILQRQNLEKSKYLDKSKKIILVTCHRRENFGEGFLGICAALLEISRREDVQIVFPVHLNPKVQEPAREMLANINNIKLIEPQEYLPFVYLMNKCHIILTDSGGIQEEAPSLGKPVLVMRNSTERPEAVSAGTVKLVGNSTKNIVASVMELMDNEKEYEKMSQAHNPYGDGKSSTRILDFFLN